jgi:hypothetical protein
MRRPPCATCSRGRGAGANARAGTLGARGRLDENARPLRRPPPSSTPRRAHRCGLPPQPPRLAPERARARLAGGTGRRTPGPRRWARGRPRCPHLPGHRTAARRGWRAGWREWSRELAALGVTTVGDATPIRAVGRRSLASMREGFAQRGGDAFGGCGVLVAARSRDAGPVKLVVDRREAGMTPTRRGDRVAGGAGRACGRRGGGTLHRGGDAGGGPRGVRRAPRAAATPPSSSRASGRVSSGLRPRDRPPRTHGGHQPGLRVLAGRRVPA